MSACELFLDEHDAGTCSVDAKHAKALSDRREARRGEWSPIVRGTDGGGARDFLGGQPIHCGTTLELQAIEYRHDDYGEYTVLVQRGETVRYETAWGGKRQVILHGSIAGHEFTAQLEPWMRFRWVKR